MQLKWLLGAIWEPKGPREEKRYQKWFGFGVDLSRFEFHFGTWRHFFRNMFLMFFLGGVFVDADFWKSKVPKRLSKWSAKGAWGYPLGSEKTMVFIVRETMRKSRGGLGGNFFQTASPDPLWRGPGKYFSRF